MSSDINGGAAVSSPTMPAAPAIPPCTTTPNFSRRSVDNDGDLLLRVGARHGGETPLEFKVCSATMRRASPVWKTMLFGPRKEAKPAQGDWIVDLPEDKPSTIDTILSMIHGNFADVPKSVTLLALNDILIYADKYDLIHVVRPWAAVPVLELSGKDHAMKIHAAWELGCEDVVSAEITDFVFNVSVAGGKTTWCYYEFESLDFRSHFGPPDLMEIVKPLRLSLIQTLLDFYHEVVESRTQSTPACTNRRHTSFAGDDKPVCDALILGGIWQYLKKAKLESLPVKAKDYSQSANDLMGRLSTMFANLPYLHDYDEDCNPAKKYAEFEKKTKQDERWKNVLRPHHKERMAAQRKKTGL